MCLSIQYSILLSLFTYVGLYILDNIDLIWPRWQVGETNDRILQQMRYQPQHPKSKSVLCKL